MSSLLHKAALDLGMGNLCTVSFYKAATPVADCHLQGKKLWLLYKDTAARGESIHLPAVEDQSPQCRAMINGHSSLTLTP